MLSSLRGDGAVVKSLVKLFAAMLALLAAPPSPNRPLECARAVS
jgi:hypothetical protein